MSNPGLPWWWYVGFGASALLCATPLLAVWLDERRTRKDAATWKAMFR